MKPVMTIALARILAGVTVLAAVAVLFGPPVLAVPGGLLLGFALPGFALTELLFRGRSVSAVERTVLAPALSLAVLVASGLLTYVSGFRLDRMSWTVSTAAVALAALAGWAVLEYQARRVPGQPILVRAGAGARQVGEQRIRLTPADDATVLVRADPAELVERQRKLALERVQEADRQAREAERLARRTGAQRLADRQAELARERIREAELRAERRRRQRRLLVDVLPLVLLVVVLSGAGWLSFHSSHDSYRVTVTTLSAAPPGPVSATGARVVTVSATGLVAADGPYLVRVTGDDGLVLQQRPVAVAAGGTWSADLTVPAAQRVTVGLYRSGEAAPYRTVLISAAV